MRVKIIEIIGINEERTAVFFLPPDIAFRPFGKTVITYQLLCPACLFPGNDEIEIPDEIVIIVLEIVEKQRQLEEYCEYLKKIIDGLESNCLKEKAYLQ